MTTRLTEDEAVSLSAWLDGETPAEARDAVERRLQSDPESARILTEYREVDSYVRRSARDAEAARPSAAVYATIEKGFARRRTGASRRARARLALPIAASIAILVSGGLWLEHRLTDRLARAEAETASFVAAAMQPALESAMSGESIPVGDRHAAVSGTVTPIRTYRSASSHWCREFKERLTVAGETIDRTAVACRESDGKWRRIETRVKGDAPLRPGLRPKI